MSWQALTRPERNAAMQSPIAGGSGRVGAGTVAPLGHVVHLGEVAAAELARCGTDLHDDVAGSLQIGGDDGVGVGHMGDRGDDQGRWNGVACAVGCRDTRC